MIEARNKYNDRINTLDSSRRHSVIPITRRSINTREENKESMEEEKESMTTQRTPKHNITEIIYPLPPDLSERRNCIKHSGCFGTYKREFVFDVEHSTYKYYRSTTSDRDESKKAMSLSKCKYDIERRERKSVV